MKKFLAILMAAMMLLAMTASFAEEATTYTITITGDTGHTYEAYQIFTGDLSGNILSNIKMGDGVNANILTVKGVTYASAAELAEKLSGEAPEIAIADFTEVVAANLVKVAGTSTEVNGVYTITGLKPGYYFIKDKDDSVPAGDAYTKFLVKIVKNIEATPKTDKTTHEKKVSENVKPVTDGKTGAAGNKYNDVADYNIGDTVPFALYSKVPDLDNFTHYEMIFHDIMSAGLTFDADSVVVTVAGSPLTAGTDYTVTTGTADGCTFEVKINELVGKGYTKGAEIRVDFNATLNSSAVIGLVGNPNQSQLEFSNNPNVTTDTTKTPWDYVVVFTYELDVTKVNGADTDEVLAGAEFVLRNAAGSYVQVDKDGKVTGWTASQDAATPLTSDATGIFKVIGLDDGNYELIETKAPNGYNLLTQPIKVVIKATTVNNQEYANKPDEALTALEIEVNGTPATGDVDTGIVNATVENNQGATLPETGGIGTTLFYLFGGLMAAGSALTLVVRRRADAEEE